MAGFTGNLDGWSVPVDVACTDERTAILVFPKEEWMPDPITDRTEADLVARMRADGFTVSAATRDILPPPDHLLPSRQSFSRVRSGFRWFSSLVRRPRVKHAAIP